MITYKKVISYILFFCLIIIASCITFNSRKGFENYDYNYETFAEDINFFDGIKIYKDLKNIPKQKQLLLLFKEDNLKYIISNDLWHRHKYKYNLIEDSIHTLDAERRNIYDRGGDATFVDSIYARKNIIIKKFSTRSIRRDNWNNNNIEVFVKNNNNIFHYKITAPYIEYTDDEVKMKTLLQLIQQNNFIINKKVKFFLQDTIDLNTIKEEEFFRKNILQF